MKNMDIVDDSSGNHVVLHENNAFNWIECQILKIKKEKKKNKWRQATIEFRHQVQAYNNGCFIETPFIAMCYLLKIASFVVRHLLLGGLPTEKVYKDL